MAGQNPQWGYTRIQGALANLSLLKTPFSLRLLMLLPNGVHAATT
jgi:hypothetical protein